MSSSIRHLVFFLQLCVNLQGLGKNGKHRVVVNFPRFVVSIADATSRSFALLLSHC